MAGSESGLGGVIAGLKKIASQGKVSRLYGILQEITTKCTLSNGNSQALGVL